jgi:hypothetical protein
MGRLFAMVMLFASSAGAQSQECSTVDNDADRLRCFDAKFPRKPDTAPAASSTAASAGAPLFEPPSAEKAAALPRFLKNFKLANEAAPSGALRADPASFSYAKLNNTQYSTAQAALIWEPAESWFPTDSYFATYGWGPIASYSINRNSLTTKQADTRQGGVGLYGTLFRISAPKNEGQLIAPIALGMVTKVEAAYRRNKVDDTESSVHTMDNWFVSRWFFDGIPYTEAFAWFVTPRLGFQLDDRKRAKPGSPLGETRAVFSQIKADLFPGMLSDRMKVSLLTQRYIDVSASDGLSKRYETFTKVGVDFILYPPRAPGMMFQPSIGLERSHGADLLSGLPKQGLTQLVFKLKVN